MEKYVAQAGDICRWSYQQVNYAKEYDGLQWSDPIALRDLAIANSAMYVRVTRPNYEPERYEVVHSIKRHQTKYYREKVQAAPKEERSLQI